MTDSIRVAIAGLGAAAQTIHLPACDKLGRVEVVGGCDPMPPAEVDFPFPVYTGIGGMLSKEKPDVLIVAAPTNHHFDLVKRGIEFGCHVLCEKPFVENMAQADEIVELAKQTGRKVSVNNEYRFMAMHRAAKRMIGDEDFGSLLFLSAHQTFHVTPKTEAGWRGKAKRRTCVEFGTHALDLCRYFFGAEPTRLTARMPRPTDPKGADYLNLIQLEFPHDRVAHVTLDRLARGRHRYLDIRLDGEHGCIETSLGGRAEVRAGINPRTRSPFFKLHLAGGGVATLYQGETAIKLATDPLDLYPSATARLLEGLIDAIDSESRAPCDVEDNRKTFALMLAAYESADTGQPIDLVDGLPADRHVTT